MMGPEMHSEPVVVPVDAAGGRHTRRRQRSIPLLVLLGLVATAIVGWRTTASDDATADGLVDADTIGMYVGFNQGARFAAMERSLGLPLEWTVIMLGSRSVSQMRSAAFGQLASDEAYLPGLSDRVNLVVTVPLGFGPGGLAKTEEGRATIRQNLLATASGDYDDDYRAVAGRLVDAGYGDAVIRLGHEFDIDWPPFSARDNEDEYIAAFRHVHDVLAAVSPAFRFDWTSTRVHFRTYGPSAYPGDAYVDVVGMDIYYRDTGPITDRVWENQYLDRLVEHREFARSHGKPVSYPEWGRAYGTSSRFVDLMHGWFASIDGDDGPGGLLYQSYFNESDDTYDLDGNPDVKQRYLELFGTDGAVDRDATTSGSIDSIGGPAEALSPARRTSSGG